MGVPAQSSGRLLERACERTPRGMIVHDRTRLIDQLELFWQSPHFPCCFIWVEVIGGKIISQISLLLNKSTQSQSSKTTHKTPYYNAKIELTNLRSDQQPPSLI